MLSALGFFIWLRITHDPEAVAARSAAVTPSPASPSEVNAALPVTTPVKPMADQTLPAKFVPATRLPWALASAPADQQTTAQQLLDFARSGDLAAIQGISREQAEALAAHLLEAIGTQEAEELLITNLGLPPGFLTTHRDPAAAAADLLDAVRGTGDSTVVRGLVFTDRVEQDGAATGNVHVIPSGTRRVYAAFENAGSLHGLDRVFAVWRNPADAKMVFAEYEPVHAGTAFNYVWLELQDGWPSGHYELALYHPQRPSELLASRSFNVR